MFEYLPRTFQLPRGFAFPVAGTRVRSPYTQPLDMGNRAMRLFRCRNLPHMDGRCGTRDARMSGAEIERTVAGMVPERKLEVALQHFTHRMFAVEHQMNAYRTWASIEAKPSNERTPGDEHYVMCMEAWERRFKPFHQHADFEGDAALMLFDCNMTYHDEAAQALMVLEERRRLRQERAAMRFKPVSSGGDACDRYNKLLKKREAERDEQAVALAASAVKAQRRKRNVRKEAPVASSNNNYDEVFDNAAPEQAERASTPSSKRPKHDEARSAPASPEKGGECIVEDAGL